MVRPKLSFEVDADKEKAIADYVRTHVSSISFLGKAKGLKVKSAILEPGTIQQPSETDSHWNVSGHVKLGIEKEDGFVDDTVVVYIAIPRIVDKFYFRISGNIYSAMYQIVDASTYNNSNAKNAKKQSITFKTIFMPIRVYKYTGKLRNNKGEDIPCAYFLGNMFKKSLLLMKYIFAKMGYYSTLEFLRVPGVVISEDDENIDSEKMYTFSVREDLFVSIPRFIYNNSIIAQSAVYTIVSVLTYMKDCQMKDVFGYDIWLKSLGAEFTTKDLDTIKNKGLSILGSLEFIYDLGTKKDLKLNDEDKDDIIDYSFDDACYNSSKRIYYYDDYMDKDKVIKFRSLRTFEKFCDDRGIYISPSVLSLMKYRVENHCCINKNVLLDENLVVLEAEESYGSMVYSAALPEEIDTMYSVLSL